MANTVITTQSNKITITYNDNSVIYGRDKANIYSSSVSDIVLVDLNGSVELWTNSSETYILSYGNTDLPIVDTIDGVAPTSLQDLYDKLSALVQATMGVSGTDIRLLAQLQPNTSTQTLYTPAVGKKAVLTHLWIAVYDNDVRVTVNHDENGTTYSKSNAWLDEVKIKKDSVVMSLPLGNIRVNNGGSIGIKIDKNQDATFSLYGYEENI